MRKTLVLLLAGFLSSQLVSAGVLTLPNRSLTLPNGLKVYLVKYPSPGVVAYQIAVHAGSRNEVEAGKTGFAHFFEHLMFRGTKSRPEDKINGTYTKLGCENNAWTWYDMTNYHGTVAKDYLGQILDLEADRFANLYFQEKNHRDEAGAVLGEYNKDVAQPEFVLEETLMKTAFTKHTYAHTTMGYKEDILKFPSRYKDVWPFFYRYYRPENARVVLVGDIDLEAAAKLVEAKFGSWKGKTGQTNPEIPVEPEQKEARTAEIQSSKPTQKRLAVAYKAPAFSTKTLESAAANLLYEIYFSPTSEFQERYRYGKKWVDALEMGPMPPETVDPGLWGLIARFTESGAGNDKALLKAVEDTLEEARTKGPKTSELDLAKRRLKNSVLTHWFSDPGALASKIAWYTNFENDLDVLNRHIDAIEKVTVKDVQDFAAKNLVKTRQTVVTLKGA